MSIQAGTYLARAVEYSYGQASTGTEQIGVKLDLLDEHEQPTGDSVTWYGFFTEKAAEYAIKDLRRLGWTGDDLMNLENEGLGSVTVPVRIYYDTHNGKDQMKVQIGGGGIAMKERMDEGQKKSFAERMRGHVVASRPAAAVTQGQGAPKPAAPQAAGRAARFLPPPPPPSHAHPTQTAHGDPAPAVVQRHRCAPSLCCQPLKRRTPA